jgi:fatty-acid desaturase
VIIYKFINESNNLIVQVSQVVIIDCDAFLMCVIARYVGSLHMAWLTNSAAHLWGDRPYDSKIGPTESHLDISTLLGEGYHNYHHTFPWDYKAAEFKWNKNVNLTSLLIDSMALIGQAYDRKSAPVDVIKARQERTGIALKPQYWLWFGGLVGWISSILFTTMPSWIFLILRLIYWQRLTLNPV